MIKQDDDYQDNDYSGHAFLLTICLVISIMVGVYCYDKRTATVQYKLVEWLDI